MLAFRLILDDRAIDAAEISGGVAEATVTADPDPDG
jgi:hypothetical protein